MLELVYIFVGLPLTLMRSRGSRSLKRPRVAYVRRARLFCLFLRSIPPICGVILAHVNVSSWLAALCFNGLYLLYYSCTGSAGTSGSILLGVTAQILGFGIFPLLMFSNAALISHLPPESVIGASPTGDADPADQPQSPKFRRCVNWLSFVFKGIFREELGAQLRMFLLEVDQGVVWERRKVRSSDRSKCRSAMCAPGPALDEDWQ